MRTKLLLTLMLVFMMAISVVAQELPPAEIDGDIVVEGITGPQGLFVDEDGNLWVLDSGLGGDREVEIIDPNSFEVVTSTFGDSGRVLMLNTDGDLEEIATLPSVVVGEFVDIVSGGGIVVRDGIAYVTVGFWHTNNGEEVTIPLYTTVAKIEDGEAEVLADIWPFELENNPDGTTNIESHPYGLVFGPDDMLYMSDAAGNFVVKIDPESGELELVAAFEGLPGVFPSPFRDGELLTDPVPTNAAFDEDGNMYVSLLSGAPFVPGSAKVVQVSEDGEVTDFAPGMTMLTDIQLAPDGNLYVVQFGLFTQEGPVPNSGAIIRILEDGTGEVVVDGLPFATKLAFDTDGGAYVAVNGIGIPQAGMVVYYEGLTDMEGMAMEMPEG